MDTDLETFLHNIAWLRESRGISKRRMCRLLHIGAATLNKIERGELPPQLTIDVAFHIYEQFHISPDQLFRRLWE